MIYNAILTRLNTNESINLGRASRGKMNLFRTMQANGDAICNLFNDCGEFEFIWNTSAKVWEFFSESGELVGRLKLEQDAKANYAVKMAYYEEAKSAYEAYQRSLA